MNLMFLRAIEALMESTTLICCPSYGGRIFLMTKSPADYITSSPDFSYIKLSGLLPPWEKIRLTKSLLTLADIHELRQIDGIALKMHVSKIVGCDLDTVHKMPAEQTLDWANALLTMALSELEND